jgi:hypothetical protein
MSHGRSPVALVIQEHRLVRGVAAVTERPDGTRIDFNPLPTPLIGGVSVLIDLGCSTALIGVLALIMLLCGSFGWPEAGPATTAILGRSGMNFMTPQDRAESLRETIHMDIDLVEGEGAGHSWRLTDKGFARIASAIREAENDAFERAAELCETLPLEDRTRYSIHLGPDYLVTRSLLSRELAAAIRKLKHKREPGSKTR